MWSNDSWERLARGLPVSGGSEMDESEHPGDFDSFESFDETFSTPYDTPITESEATTSQRAKQCSAVLTNILEMMEKVDTTTHLMFMNTLRRVAGDLARACVVPPGEQEAAPPSVIRNPESNRKRGRPSEGADVTQFNKMISGRTGAKKMKQDYLCSNCHKGNHRARQCAQSCQHCNNMLCANGKGEACRLALQKKVDAYLRTSKRRPAETASAARTVKRQKESTE
jgi:hypothetical protein